jgi:hypothetical protein
MVALAGSGFPLVLGWAGYRFSGAVNGVLALRPRALIGSDEVGSVGGSVPLMAAHPDAALTGPEGVGSGSGVAFGGFEALALASDVVVMELEALALESAALEGDSFSFVGDS